MEVRAAQDDDSVLARFAARVAAGPERPALSGAGCAVTYAELDAWANRIAIAILDHPAGTCPNVAIVVDHGPVKVAATVGALKSGRTLAAFDATYPDAALAELVAHAEAGVVLTDAPNARRAKTIGGHHCAVVVVDVIDALPDRRAPAVRIDPGALAYLRYTSGSTGAPKGVMHSHATALHLALTSMGLLRLAPEDRLALFNPFWMSLVLGALMAGATLRCFDLKRDAMNRIGPWLDDNRVTILPAFPTVFRQIAAALDRTGPCATVRCVFLSGEPVLDEDVRAARRLFPPVCVLINGYGSAEFSQIAAFHCPRDGEIPGRLPAGHAVGGVEILVLDEQGRRAPAGTRGEVAVRAAHMTSGYWRRPDLTRRTLIADPDGGPAPVYATGDVGWVDAGGCLRIAGRRDQQIKVRDHRVMPAEVEDAITAHPAVKEAAVVAREGARGVTRLAAYVVPRADETFDATALRAFLRDSVPSYMVPTWFVAVSALPTLENGKVDRRALAALEPPGRRVDPAAAPRDALEAGLVDLWEETLGTAAIGIHDDFVDLGGDSLAATAMILEIARAYGVELEPEAAFGQGSTVAGLAELIRARPKSRSDPAPASGPRDVDFVAFGSAYAGPTPRRAALFYTDPDMLIRRARPGAIWGPIAFNSLGFRGPEIAMPKPAGTVRLAFLGDSVAFDARATDNSTTWPHRVRDRLADAFPARTIDYINAALPGFGARHNEIVFRRSVASLAPDVVVIHTSDMNRDTAYLARATGLFGGVHDRPTWLARRSLSWAIGERTMLSLARRVGAVHGRGRLRILPADLTRAFEQRLTLLVATCQASAGVVTLLIVGGRLRRDQGLIERFAAASTTAYYMPYLSLEAMLDAHDAYDAAIRAVARRTGALLIDAADLLPADSRHYLDSAHLTARGGRRLADAIARALAEAPAVRALLERDTERVASVG